MRIGFDITALYIAQAGVFEYDRNLIQACLDTDRENEYLLLDYHPIHGRRTAPPQIADLAARGSKIVHCGGLRHRRLARWGPAQRAGLRPLAEWVDRTLFWPWAIAARAVMRKRLSPLLEGLDVFHSSEVLLWRQPGAVNVVTIYDLTALLLPECHTDETRELQMAKYRFAQEEADAVIAISESTRQDIVRHLGIPASRTHVVYGGVGPDFRPITDRAALEQDLAQLGLAEGDYVLHVGTIEPRKNLTHLIHAYGRARDMMPTSAPRLVLAGSLGWKFRQVLECIGRLDLEGEVVLLGQVPPRLLPSLYNGAALFAYPSLYEGFGLPCLEAMACGTPVVATNTSSLPEIVGDAGWLVDPTDVDALASALVKVLCDAETRSTMRAAGLARAARFSWQRAAHETREVYRTSLAR